MDKATSGPLILLGLLSATFSSALSSLVGASRIMQAIAEHKVLPGSSKLAKFSKNGEPRNALFTTGAIGLGALVFGLVAGGINAIAPLITMFFLIMYATLNGVVVMEQTLGLISFRPLLKIPRFIPLIGLTGSLFVMFLINPVFSLIAIVLTVLLYAYLGRRQLITPWGDVRSGLFVAIAEWAAKHVISLPESERAWKPKFLIPVKSTAELVGSYRLVKSLAFPRGTVLAVGLTQPGRSVELNYFEDQVESFRADGIFSRSTRIEGEYDLAGLKVGMDVERSGFFRPNTVFLAVNQISNPETLEFILEHAQVCEMGAAIFAQHPVTGLGREQIINVWIREQSPAWEVGLRLSNLDLALLLAYQLAINWQGKINLITVVSEEDERENAIKFLEELINFGRMPRGSRAIVGTGDFQTFMAHAPHADLNVFGIQGHNPTIDQYFIHKLVEETGASCLFVRDSGKESALA